MNFLLRGAKGGIKKRYIFGVPLWVAEKVCFFKKVLVLYPYKNALWALRPAKPLGVLSRHPCRNPKPLPLGERQCMLGWFCIVQSLWAYTPGVRAGAECWAAALTKQGRLQSVAHSRCTMQRHQRLTTRMGLRPKQGCFGCLPKVLHDAKPTEQATLNPHFKKLYIFLTD